MLFISTREKKLTLKHLDNQDGQIAIFIALIFQILFIFFAMLINVGLIVHDKINLQNAVDLAAYYGAERQAEILDQIAHVNYQIRQENKLLAWRQHILGPYAFGKYLNMPVMPPPNEGPPPNVDDDAICVDHAGWMEPFSKAPNDPIQNCKASSQQKPAPPTFSPIAVFLPITIATQAYFQKVADTIGKDCDGSGPVNWLAASIWFYEYKTSIKKRSDYIRSLATNLSAPASTMTDFHGESVAQGVQRTFLRNLTEANRNSIASKSSDNLDQPGSLSMINSMSAEAGSCGSVSGNGNPNWLNENYIHPMLAYINAIKSGGCNLFRESLTIPPAGAPQIDPSNFAAYKATNAGEPPPGVNSNGYSSAGFEKNPWCLTYFGVKAMTKPRKPFAPFGGTVSLYARGFASPFGGRIGPWTHTEWPVGSPKSLGGALTDQVMVKRADEANTTDFNTTVPNYSRFPGDQLGLKANLAHYLYLNTYFSAVPPSKATPQMSLGGYSHLTLQNNKNVLYHDPAKPNTASFLNLGALENAAIAPDLFDITYYSIDPYYYQMFYNPKDNSALLGDLGSDLQNPSLQSWNVYAQMTQTKSMLLDKFKPPLIPQAINWLVPNLDFLLTGWTQGATGVYPAAPPLFATCLVHPNLQQGWPPVPGNCVVGGRTGYSVRTIGRKYLRASGLELGGQGITGKISNPPPSGW